VAVGSRFRAQVRYAADQPHVFVWNADRCERRPVWQVSVYYEQGWQRSYLLLRERDIPCDLENSSEG
jgi:hypothetical protein